MKQLTESHDCVIPWSSVDLDLYHNYKPGKGAENNWPDLGGTFFNYLRTCFCQ